MLREKNFYEWTKRIPILSVGFLQNIPSGWICVFVENNLTDLTLQ